MGVYLPVTRGKHYEQKGTDFLQKGFVDVFTGVNMVTAVFLLVQKCHLHLHLVI